MPIYATTITRIVERNMNQDVQYAQDEPMGNGLSDRLTWDWHNPLIAIPLGLIGVLLLSALAMAVSLLSA